ncbi:MAG: hypothetical protein D6706_00455 [Chloroflexi bacterium]|nr:MAG: hypothetical protein D6706_00455 [Chloroflexota bacterium]
MAIFKRRLPSRQDLLYVFAACAFPVHVWLIINVMREVPAWILRLSMWDLLGVVAYSLLFALLETAVVTVFFVVLGMMLPQRWIQGRFVSLATLLVMISAVWFVVLHYNSQAIENRQIVTLGIWLASYLLVMGGAVLALYRSQRVETAVAAFVQRLVVLSFFYIVVDIFGLFIVISRQF